MSGFTPDSLGRILERSMEKEPIERGTWPRSERRVDLILIATIVFALIGILCLSFHIPAMWRELAGGVREILR